MPQSTRGRCVELRLQGKGVRAIARDLGIQHSAVHGHLNHPEARRVLDAVGRNAVQVARDVVEESVPEIARKAVRVARGLEKATPQQVQAMKLVMTLAGMEPTKRVELSGGFDVRSADTEALRSQLAALRAVTDGDDSPADEG